MAGKYKVAWIVTGPESSGSVFVAQALSYAVGKCTKPGEYSGYGYNNNDLCENLVLHRSIPYMRPKRFSEELLFEISRFENKYENINYILTTRDNKISLISKTLRFGDTQEEGENDYAKSIDFFKKLAINPKVFIWNYETMVFLGESYFKRMYNFFGIESNYIPLIRNENYKYIHRKFAKNNSGEIVQI